MERIKVDDNLKELTEQVKDISKAVEERRAALKLICSLRGESDAGVNQIPEGDLRMVVSAMTAWPSGMKGLSLRDAADAVSEGKARSVAGNLRR